MVLDTRKTLPGLRQAQKYAVRVGGASNQRLALWDGILIKENHIAAAGSIAAAWQQAQTLQQQMFQEKLNLSLQIEVENMEELEQSLAAGADNILLDNFELPQLRAAVERVRGQALLEASGGVSLAQIRQIAACGVDRISVGRLTKDIRAIDFSLRVSRVFD